MVWKKRMAPFTIPIQATMIRERIDERDLPVALKSPVQPGSCITSLKNQLAKAVLPRFYSIGPT
jgi:hypothetical protein